ncbi:mechanosensitive ion channel family protein [uncultured Psychrobacter sp.]|uniref:mechanosensitive ion channel family protein n=1 Tax=uncultured Psychrobacter sp. TaxID=259303 RepID=UPI0034591277
MSTFEMDTFKNIVNHRPLDGLKSYNSRTKRYEEGHNLVRFILSFLIIAFSVISTSVQAATDSTQPDIQEQVTGQADDLMGYIEQEVETLKEEGINLPDNVSEAINSTERNAVQQAGYMQGDTALSGDYNANYLLLDELNTGLPPLSPPPNLATPLATLEFFQSAVMKQQSDLAAHALNMNLLDPKTQPSRGIELAKRLDFLLDKKDLYVFDDLPDRPDGLVEPPIGSSSSISGIPRRSIQLGYMDYRERQVPITMQRVRVGDSAPIWVFSAQTVGNIDNLYAQYKPATFERYLPSILTLRFFDIAVWEFLALILFFLATMGLGWIFSKVTGAIINWYVGEDDDLSKVGSKKSITDLVNKLTVPLTFTISLSLVFTLVSGGFPFIDAVATTTRPIVWIALTLSTIWLGIRIINFFANRYQDFHIEGLDEEEYDKYRIRSTYVSVFRRIFIFVMILGGIWIGLSEFANLEGLGKTLLTSAGIAGVVIGIAAQPTLGNIVAGMQIAVTQPIRIGDTVMIDGTWCTVHDLRYTYAILKTWDERHLFIPMRYFVTEIVENWSHPELQQMRPMYLYLDYGIDIEEVRQKFFELVKAHELWDGETDPVVLAVSMDEDTIKLRCAMSSDGPDNAWAMECDIREQMLAYLYDEQKPYLPADRITFKEG